MNNALFWGAYCWCSLKFKIGHFFTKSRLTKLLQCEISQKFTKHFQILILWVQRKGFKDDIQTFWLSWHDSPGNSRGIWWGTSEVSPLSGSFEKEDSLVRVKGCNNIGGKSCRSEKNWHFGFWGHVIQCLVFCMRKQFLIIFYFFSSLYWTRKILHCYNNCIHHCNRRNLEN